MNITRAISTAVLICALAALFIGAAFADAPPEVSVAQIKPVSTAADSAKAPDTTALSERIRALEKENLVLREDLGRARLDVRAQMEAAAKRQAEAIAALNKELDDTHARLEAERAAQARRNRKLWVAVGVLAIGIALSD